MRLRLIPCLLAAALALPAAGADSDFERGASALVAGQDELAFHIFLRDAKSGNVAAKHAVGTLYVNGRGVEPDAAEGARWLLQSAKAGLAESQAQLAALYASGDGVEKDPEEAARLYRRAAVQGHSGAQASLGVLAYLGKGTPHSNIESYVWTSLAAEQGEASARVNLEQLKPQLTPYELERAEAQLRVYKRRLSRRQKNPPIPLAPTDSPDYGRSRQNFAR